ncbi:MAG: hypothetical protein ACI9GB_003851, partial [Halioglobus sp.]
MGLAIFGFAGAATLAGLFALAAGFDLGVAFGVVVRAGLLAVDLAALAIFLSFVTLVLFATFT